MPRGKPTVILRVRVEPELLADATDQAERDEETLSDFVRDGMSRELKARRRAGRVKDVEVV